ncbi:MAG TPA: hypothetical protein VMU11_03725 [Verrucomicrobiae bacterium]|nr:hypothetical protein [Verrucomicrobiae bacterium]
MRRFSSITALVLTAVLAFGPAWQASAQTARLISDIVPASDLQNGFDPNLILDDNDIFDLGGMDLNQLRAFLSTRGTLGQIKVRDIDGVMKPPADVIWRVATSYKLNPKYLLALMQKEQSLVEDPDPTQKQFDWATGFAVCDSCSMDDPSIQDYKGFANQLEYAAKQHRERYLLQLLGKGTTISGYAPGKLATIDGVNVTPVNNATAMLYTYTPHIHGNLNLWHIWRRWFSLSFPDGTLVQAKTSGTYYLIRNGQKKAIGSKAIAASMFDISKAVVTEDSQLSGYPDGQSISFPNYSVVRTEDAKLYLIVGEKKRLIANKAIFTKLGFVEDDVVDGTNADLTAYTDGTDITSEKQYPTGLLAKDPAGTVWYIEDGVKHKVPSAAFLNLYFKGKKAKALTQKQIDAYKTGDDYHLRDGELVKSDKGSAVYVVENGALRPIASGDVFEQLGWQWRNVITLPAKLVASYQVGLPVTLQSPPLLTDDGDATGTDTGTNTILSSAN